MKSIITQTRKSRGKTLEEVAAAVGTDQTNLSRVEKGLQVPKRALARSLFAYYEGTIELGRIYDPMFGTEPEADEAQPRRRAR